MPEMLDIIRGRSQNNNELKFNTLLLIKIMLIFNSMQS